MANKEKYREFCKTEKDIPIFSKDWWLDSVCGVDSWDVALVEKSGQIVASMPYCLKKKLWFKLVYMPQLTQTMGPFIKYPKEQKYLKRIAFEKKYIQKLINLLPYFSKFNQNLHYSLNNWQPFFWKLFKQTTLYTYIIDNISDYDDISSIYHSSKRGDIRKAKRNVKVYEDLTSLEFYELHEHCLQSQKKVISYSLDFFTKIYEACKKRGQCKIICAKDSLGNVHSSLFLVWDADCVYNLISAIDFKYRNIASASLLFDYAIRFAGSIGRKFNFEGSMIEDVEKSYRNFGGEQVPYFKIEKTNSFLIKIKESIRYIMSK